MADRDELVEATVQVRNIRQGVTEKLEQYREQYEEMHIRALTAEMEAASTRMKLEKATRDINSHKTTVLDLIDELSIERTRNTDTEASLRIAKEKITKLRTKLKTEFDKLLSNQKDLRIGVNSLMRCVHEYKNEVITQKDFFCAVHLIFSSIIANDDTCVSPLNTSSINSNHIGFLFTSDSLQELASLPPERRRQKLQVYLDHLSSDILFSQTSDKILSCVFEDPSSIAPPIPAKPTNYQRSKVPNWKPMARGAVVPPPLPPKVQPMSFGQHASKRTESNSDSDFEGNDEIEKIRSSSNYNDPKRCVLKRNKTTTVTSSTIKLSERKRIIRYSRSCGNLFAENESDKSYDTLPCQQLGALHKMVSIRDSSVLTGSLPRLNVINEQNNIISYVTPNEFKAFVCHIKRESDKISHRASTRVMKRVDSFLKSYCTQATDQDDYLDLVRNNDGFDWLRKSIKDNKMKKVQTPPTPSRPRISYENHTVRPRKVHPPKGSSTSSVSATLDPVLSDTPSSPITTPTQFDDPVYEDHSGRLSSTPKMHPQTTKINSPTKKQNGKFATVDYSYNPPIATQVSSTVPIKPYLADIELRKRDSDLIDGERPPASLPRPLPTKPKPPPKPRTIQKGSIDSNPKPLHSSGNEAMTSSGGGGFPEPIPTYCTLKQFTHSLRLVPILHQDDNISDEEEPGDYSLGTFQFVMNKTQSDNVKETTYVPKVKVSSSDSDNDSGGYETPPDATAGYIEPRTAHTLGACRRDNRSYTTNLMSKNKVVEKQGYMDKLDPSLKRWTRRWFVLKGKELKYYSKMKSRKPKGVINLEAWCKISRHEMTSSFQLATPSRTYHFVADTNIECEDWIKALQTVMRTSQYRSSLLQQEDIVSGWIKIIRVNDGHALKCWASISDQSLHIYQSSADIKPLHVINLLNGLIRYTNDVPSNVQLIPKTRLSHFTVKEEYSIVIQVGGACVDITEDNEESITLILSSKEEMEMWFFHLISASSGDTGPELTLTEKLVTRLWRSKQQQQPIADSSNIGTTTTTTISTTALCSNPLLSYTSEHIDESLLSHPSTTQNNEAIRMFKVVNLFMSTQFDTLGLDYHIMSVQQLVTKCLSSPGLRDELYCQILRQISIVPGKNTDITPTNILQGWFLLALIIQLFLPTRKIFRWYLEAYLVQTSNKNERSKHIPGVSDAATICHQRFIRAEKKGPREKTPSWFEMHYLMSGPIHISSFMLSLKLKLPVNLMNDTTLLMEFDSSTEIQEFISHINQEIGMPDSETTGFSLMSDWPGEDDESGFYLFPSNKLCDIISTWSECLSELGSTMHTRIIQLTYRKRLYFRSRRGHESDKEALLFAYQISKDVLNEYFYISNIELALDVTARMTQIDYGDCVSLDSDQQQTARDAIRRFCPMKFTKMILPHDMDVMVDKLLSKWLGYTGINRHTCARMLLSLFADNWELFGATLFHCSDRYAILTNIKNGPIQLAVHENGITLLNANYLTKPIVSYSYKEIATFGGHCNDFMLVINSRQLLTAPTLFNHESSVHTEKIILSMSKLKIREATYLMASYLDSFNITDN